MLDSFGYVYEPILNCIELLTDFFSVVCLSWNLVLNAVHLTMDFALQGFDEYMNLVLDDAEEVSMKRKTRKTVGKTFDPC